jgi:crossover junction endodeoxyribonuclease RuvC
MSERLWTLGQDLTELIHRHHPDIAVIETIFFGTNRKTAMMTAHARGVLTYVMRQHHIPVTSLTPLQIKSQITGYGQASKQQMISAVTARLNLDRAPQPDDAADALAAALCAVEKKTRAV